MKPEKKRDELIEEYMALRDELRKQTYHRAFLSIDLAGSTEMKRDEDTLDIEHSFRRYHLFLEEIFNRHHVVNFTGAGDGSMSIFSTSQDAVNATIELLKTIEVFNQQQNRLRNPFRPRCGVHTGDIYADESTPVEDIVSIEIDIAGHLQKTANPNGLLISESTFKEITNKTDFLALPEPVDAQQVWQLRTDTAPPEPSPKDEQRSIAKQIVSSLYDAWARHTIISLTPVLKESGWHKEWFHTIVELLEDRGLIKSYGSSYSYEITPDGVLYAEDTSVVPSEVADWHRRIRRHILTFLTELYETKGSRADAHFEKIAKGGPVEPLEILVDLSLLTKLGWVEATSINTFRITFDGLRATRGDDDLI